MEKNNKKPWTLLAVLALIGVGLLIQLTTHYYEIRSGMSDFRSFCNINAKMNCDVVAASPYAELAGGYPLSSFGAGWYLALFFIALFGRNRFWRREAGRVALGMTGLGLLLSLGYLGVMMFKIKTYCLFCLFVDGIGLLSLLTVLIGIKPETSLSEHKADAHQWKALLGTIAGCVLVSVFALKLFDTVSITSSEVEERVNATLSTSVLPIETVSNLSFGPENAPITIVEFSDFQCPYCKLGATIMNSLVERYPAQVRVIYKPFPLDASCNRVITQPMHLTACEAARVAICAAKAGKFADVYETLFDHQTDILPGTPAQMAQKAGVNAQELDACVKTQEVSQEISKSIEEGIQLGVQSTPTFFVNGHKVEGPLPGPFWDRLIQKLLH